MALSKSPFTLRVFSAGLLLCLLISVATPYTNMYLQGSLMALDFGTAAALFLLFLLVCINAILHRCAPAMAFQRGELAVIYAMMATACAIPTMGLMEYLLPGMTALEYYATPSLGILRDTVNLPIMLSFSAVGIFFFVNLDIALGLWVFTLLAMLEKGAFSVVGLHSTEVVSVYGTPESPLLAHQGIGALLAYVVVGLWQARSHFATVGRQAWKGHAGDEDAGEIMSYRAAVLGLSGGIAVMVLWLWSSGIPLLPLLVFLAVALLIFFGLSRIVVEGGVAAARSPMIASTFAVSGLGTSIVGAEGLVALPSIGLCYLYGILYRRATLVQRILGLVVQSGRAQVRRTAAAPHGAPLLYGPNPRTVLQRRVLAHSRWVYRYYRQRNRCAVLVKNPLRAKPTTMARLAGLFIGHSFNFAIIYSEN